MPKSRWVASDRIHPGKDASITISVPQPASIHGSFDRKNFPDAESIILTKSNGFLRYRIEFHAKQSDFKFPDLAAGDYSIGVFGKPKEMTRNGQTFYNTITLALRRITLTRGEAAEVTITELDKKR